MNEMIIQIIPTLSNLMCGYDGGTAQPVAYLALVGLVDDDCKIRTMGLANCETFEEQTGVVFFFE